MRRTISSRYAIAMDVGGTHIRSALIDKKGQIFFATRRSTEMIIHGCLPKLVDIIDEIVSRTEGKRIAGVGIGIAALVNKEEGTAKYAPNIPECVNVPIKKIIEKETGIPTFVGKDSNFAALGEQWIGAGKGYNNLILMTLGTGLGCGIIIQGNLYLGQGSAGEFGHTIIDQNGPRCNCGNFGCLETLAAGPAIAKKAKRVIEQGKRSLIKDLAKNKAGNVTPELVFEAAERKDEIAIKIVEEVGNLIGIGLTNLIYLFDPKRILIGGGLSAMGKTLLKPIKKTIQRRCYLVSRNLSSVDVVLAKLGDQAGLVGAAKFVFQNLATKNPK
ncbi:MAG: ROK family protein [bacterium]